MDSPELPDFNFAAFPTHHQPTPLHYGSNMPQYPQYYQQPASYCITSQSAQTQLTQSTPMQHPPPLQFEFVNIHPELEQPTQSTTKRKRNPGNASTSAGRRRKENLPPSEAPVLEPRGTGVGPSVEVDNEPVNHPAFKRVKIPIVSQGRTAGRTDLWYFIRGSCTHHGVALPSKASENAGSERPDDKVWKYISCQLCQ